MNSISRQSHIPEFNMIALLDIIFIVVIFCIIGMTKMVFLNLVKVDNPELRTSQHMNPDKFITISLTKEKKLFLDKEPVSSQKELVERLMKQKNSQNNIVVIINGDKEVPLESALHVLETVRNAQFSSVYFKSTGENR